MTHRVDAPGPLYSQPQPERIGPYRVRQQIGKGGMGVVYEAEETGPVRRPVAIKVIRAELDSHEVIARFEAERQALAVMNHPGIARVLHAGTTDGGQPYVAMELVRGLPITEYCDQKRLSVRQRLELFALVCHAVQHAHQKGVVHRDLKPSNVLVTDGDGAPQPKIIDFGIAKAVGQQLTDKTVVTRWGEAMGTAAYMSPEQADASGLDVDTRADIYSLGVMLYELLVGRLPVDPAEVGLHVFLSRLVTWEADPPRPSVRLATPDTRGGDIARFRRTDPVQLRRQLQGDLDWIVMKAMDPDRSRRYETANALAVDIRHFLADEPVAARPPSAAYRVAKFVRRHRVGVALGTGFAVALTAFAVLAWLGFVRATRAEQRAQREAAAAREVTSFLVDLFGVAAPGEERPARGREVTARELLDRGAGRVEERLSAQPELLGRIQHTLGTVYGKLGHYAQGRALLLKALEQRRRERGPNDPTVGETLTELALLARYSRDFVAADTLYARALRIRETALGPSHPDVGITLSGIAALRADQDSLVQAESLYRRVLPIDSARGDGPRLANDLAGLAAVRYKQGRLQEAEALALEAQRIQAARLPEDHPDLAATRNTLATVYFGLGRFDEALEGYRQVAGAFERTLGRAHPELGAALSNMGETYAAMHRAREADSLYARALGVYRAAGLGREHALVKYTSDKRAEARR